MVLGRRPPRRPSRSCLRSCGRGWLSSTCESGRKSLKAGELVDKEILHPKYRLMMEIKRRRAGQRGARREAALAATAARRTGTSARPTRSQKWKDEEERRLRNSIENVRYCADNSSNSRKKNDDMKRRDDKRRLKERKARKANIAQDAAEGVGHELYHAMEERARKKVFRRDDHRGHVNGRRPRL